MKHRNASCVNEVLYDTSISLDRVFIFKFVKCLCIGAPSKGPAQRFVDLGFRIFEKQEKQEDKRLPKSQTTTGPWVKVGLSSVDFGQKEGVSLIWGLLAGSSWTGTPAKWAHEMTHI